MKNYIIETKFSNCTLKVKDVFSEDKLHFTLNIEIITSKFTTSYTFNELIYWQLPFKKKENCLEIYDECSNDCRCIIDKEKIELIIKDDKISNISLIKLNQGEDQEKLIDFIIELNALCETLLK